MSILARARLSAGVLMSGLTAMLVCPAAVAQNRIGLENLSSTQVYGVTETRAVPARELPPPAPFFDPSQWQVDTLPASDADVAFSFSDYSLSGAGTASLARSIQYSRQSSPIWRARWLPSSADQVWVFGDGKAPIKGLVKATGGAEPDRNHKGPVVGVGIIGLADNEVRAVNLIIQYK